MNTDLLNGLLTHIKNGSSNYPLIKTIEIYSGQLAAALKNKSVVKLPNPLPAVYIVFIDGAPLSIIPRFTVELLICAESRAFNKYEKFAAAYNQADLLLQFLSRNPSWLYLSKSYSINLSDTKISTLLTDDALTILSLSLSVKMAK